MPRNYRGGCHRCRTGQLGGTDTPLKGRDTEMPETPFDALIAAYPRHPSRFQKDALVHLVALREAWLQGYLAGAEMVSAEIGGRISQNAKRLTQTEADMVLLEARMERLFTPPRPS